MSVKAKIPHTARFLMTFHTAGGRAATQTQEATVTADPFASVTAPAAPAAAPQDCRTQPQRELMDKLLNELDGRDLELAGKAREYTEGMTAHGKWTPGRDGNASAWISKLIDKNRELRLAAKAAPAPAAQAQEELEDGMYAKVVDGARRVFKVVHAVHGSGRQYAKELVVAEDGGAASWERAPGMVRKLTAADKMTLEEAQAFGRIYGVCCRCAAPLTDEASIAAGIGPICAGKM